MYTLYYVGNNILNFAIALLLVQPISYIKRSFLKKSSIKNDWYNVILSLAILVFNQGVGFTALIVTLIVALIGIKKQSIRDKKISDWAFGLTIALAGLIEIGDPSDGYYGTWIFVLIGGVWIWLTVFNKSSKILKLSPKIFYSLTLLLVGLIVFAIGDYSNKNTAHITTDNSSVDIGKKDVTVSGVATPNSRVKTYLDGEEVKPSEKTDEDGNFSFQAETPGKWTVAVTKNGTTAKAKTVVHKSKAWQKYQAKEGAKKAKKEFAEEYEGAFDKLDSLGVKEYNKWAELDNAGGGGTIDDTLEQIQKDNKADVLLITMEISTLQDDVKKLQQAGEADADTYKSYYADIKKLEQTVLNPPAGEIDNFGDAFEEQRGTVNSNLDLL